jgi:hypothetical protein
MARPERFELPTTWFVARYSIQLSYGRECQIIKDNHVVVVTTPKAASIQIGRIRNLAEREGFEPSMGF